MALQEWVHARHRIDIPWKIFVRETSGAQEDECPERRTCQLTFQGNEAKVAYEEIVCLSSGAPTTTRSRCSIAKNASEGDSNASSPTLSANARMKRTAIPDVLTKVTINALLKAVEQKDLKFLQQHMTSENINVSDDFGWTPLMCAAYCGYFDIVQFLLNLGANRRIRDRSGLTAAQLALKRNYLSIVALLRKKSESMSNSCIQSHSNVARTNSTSAVPAKSAILSVDSTRDYWNVSGPMEENIQLRLQQNVAFYCEICRVVFQETTPQKHESSTVHIFNTKPKLKHAMYSISKQNKGYKMLLNSGWDEEVGLGPMGKGIKYPIKTCLKMDRKGLGQPSESEYRVTHFKAGDATAVNAKAPKQKPLKKRDRERLVHREVRKERALRIALS